MTLGFAAKLYSFLVNLMGCVIFPGYNHCYWRLNPWNTAATLRAEEHNKFGKISNPSTTAQGDKGRWVLCVGLKEQIFGDLLVHAQDLRLCLWNTLTLLLQGLPLGSSHCSELGYAGTGQKEKQPAFIHSCYWRMRYHERGEVSWS